MTIPLEQRPVLESAANTLAEEFQGTFGAETIKLFLTTSYDQFAGGATVVNFLPLMAERFARQRLAALARVEGRASGGVPVVLFPVRPQRRAVSDGPRVVQASGR